VNSPITTRIRDNTMPRVTVVFGYLAAVSDVNTTALEMGLRIFTRELVQALEKAVCSVGVGDFFSLVSSESTSEPRKPGASVLSFLGASWSDPSKVVKVDA
jgi:hypothetical protein